MDPGSGHEFHTCFSASTRGYYYGRHATLCQWALIHPVQSSLRVNFPRISSMSRIGRIEFLLIFYATVVTIKGSYVSILSRHSLFADSCIASPIIRRNLFHVTPHVFSSLISVRSNGLNEQCG